MFARILLFIAVVIGLAAGPAWPREQCSSIGVASICKCCEGASCCAGETAPRDSTPVPASNSNAADLKLALQPWVAVIPRIFAVERPVVRTVAAMAVAAPVGVQIDRICVRLI
jgi:hypothetical protein